MLAQSEECPKDKRGICCSNPGLGQPTVVTIHPIGTYPKLTMFFFFSFGDIRT